MDPVAGDVRREKVASGRHPKQHWHVQGSPRLRAGGRRCATVDGRHVWGHAHHSNHGPRRGHRPQNGVEDLPRADAHGGRNVVRGHDLGLRVGVVFGLVALDFPGVGHRIWIVFGEHFVPGGWPRHESARHRHHAGRGGRHGVGFPWQAMAWCRGGGIVCGAAFGRQPRPNDLLPAVLVGGHRCGGDRDGGRAIQVATDHARCGPLGGRGPCGGAAPNQPTRLDRAILAVHHPRGGRVGHVQRRRWRARAGGPRP